MIESKTSMPKTQIDRSAINLGLLFTCFAAALSGFAVQIGFHMGHHGKIDESAVIFGLDYLGWSAAHKISIVILSCLVTYHMVLHRRWYKTVIQKKLFRRNKTAIALTITFIVVALTGYVPWLIDSVAGNQTIRKSFIEIHDKITFILFPLIVIHIVHRFRWFIASFRTLKNSKLQL